MKAVILGTGRSGKAASEFLKHHGWQTLLCEELPEDLDFSLGVVSPGISLRDARCQKLHLAGIEVIGELELGLRFLDRKAVGVTGTNGKSTTVEMIAHMTGGVACGNNGYALTRALLETKGLPLVIEMSSFQLETAQTPCLEAAVILNIEPDHLDRYDSFEDYVLAKERIRLCLKPGAPLFRDLDTADAAQKLADILGCVKSAESFTFLPHRLEFVGDVEGVRFINDSKATNVSAVLYALQKQQNPVILLAGGLDKGADFSGWKKFASKVHKVFAFGKAADHLERVLQGDFTVVKVESLSQATKKAFKEASIGDTILLSPGCASFDQFASFEERGEKFKSFVWECENES